MPYQDPSDDPYAGLFTDEDPRAPAPHSTPLPPPGSMGMPEPAWRQLRQPVQTNDLEAELVVLDPGEAPSIHPAYQRQPTSQPASWLMQPDDAPPPPVPYDPDVLVPAPGSA